MPINDLGNSEVGNPLTIKYLRRKKKFDFGAQGGYCIGMIKTKEHYDLLKAMLEDNENYSDLGLPPHMVEWVATLLKAYEDEAMRRFVLSVPS